MNKRLITIEHIAMHMHLNFIYVYGTAKMQLDARTQVAR